MVAAGRVKPRTLRQLSELREFKHRGAARRLRTWADTVSRALALPESELPPKRAPQEPDALPAPRSWRDREPEAAVRLEVVKAVIRAHAERISMPQENLLTPEFQRRLAWRPPQPATEQRIGDFLSDLGARPWQVEQVAGRLAAGFAEPDSVLAAEQVESGEDT